MPVNDRALIEQLLSDSGLRPEALPNMFELLGNRRHAAMPAVLSDLAKWRLIFPETIDSITGIWAGQDHIPYENQSRTLALEDMRPNVSSLYGNPQDLADNPRLRENGPSLYDQILEYEPHAPRTAGQRFYGVLPHEALYGDLDAIDALAGARFHEAHPLARNRMLGMATQGAPAGPGFAGRAYLGRSPNWGDILAADALMERLKYEDHATYLKVLEATTLGGGIPDIGDTGRRGLMRRAMEGGRRGVARNEAARRVAQIYSAQPGRMSSRVEPATLQPEVDPDLPPPSIRELMRQSEFRGGQTGAIPGENASLARSAKAVAPPIYDAEGALLSGSPANARIQSVLNTRLGKAGGMMPGIALAMLAPIVADKVSQMWRDKD